MGLKEILALVSSNPSAKNLLGNRFEFLLLFIVLLFGSFLGVVEPRNGLVDSGLKFRLVGGVEFIGKFLVSNRVTEVIGI